MFYFVVVKVTPLGSGDCLYSPEASVSSISNLWSWVLVDFLSFEASISGARSENRAFVPIWLLRSLLSSSSLGHVAVVACSTVHLVVSWLQGSYFFVLRLIFMVQWKLFLNFALWTSHFHLERVLFQERLRFLVIGVCHLLVAQVLVVGILGVVEMGKHNRCVIHWSLEITVFTFAASSDCVLVNLLIAYVLLRALSHELLFRLCDVAHVKWSASFKLRHLVFGVLSKWSRLARCTASIVLTTALRHSSLRHVVDYIVSNSAHSQFVRDWDRLKVFCCLHGRTIAHRWSS